MIDATVVQFRVGYAVDKRGPFHGHRTVRALIVKGVLRRLKRGINGQNSPVSAMAGG